MTHPWLVDCADRLEAAAEVARDLQALGTLGAGPLRVRVEYLAERLWETAQRMGILQTLAPGPRAQLAHCLCDLYRVARRGHALALADTQRVLSDGLEAIASELQTLIAEIAAFDRADPGPPAARRAPVLVGSSW